MIDPKITPIPKTVSDNVVWSKMSIEEASRICRGTMTKEESDRLDAETPPFVAETDPRRMNNTKRGPLLNRPAFDPEWENSITAAHLS